MGLSVYQGLESGCFRWPDDAQNCPNPPRSDIPYCQFIAILAHGDPGIVGRPRPPVGLSASEWSACSTETAGERWIGIGNSIGLGRVFGDHTARSPTPRGPAVAWRPVLTVLGSRADAAWRRLGLGQLGLKVVHVAEAARDGRLEEIDNVPLGDTYRWKIAFHYQPFDAPTSVGMFQRKRCSTRSACRSRRKKRRCGHCTGALASNAPRANPSSMTARVCGANVPCPPRARCAGQKRRSAKGCRSSHSAPRH